MARISIPPIQEFRNHLLFAALYVKAHQLFAEMGEMPSFGMERVVDKTELDNFISSLNGAGAKGDLVIDEHDVCLSYACLDCMSKLLVSQYDKIILDKLFEMYPETAIGPFESFRNNILSINVFLMKDTEEKFPELQQLQELKEKLNTIEID